MQTKVGGNRSRIGIDSCMFGYFKTASHFLFFLLFPKHLTLYATSPLWTRWPCLLCQMKYRLTIGLETSLVITPIVPTCRWSICSRRHYGQCYSRFQSRSCILHCQWRWLASTACCASYDEVCRWHLPHHSRLEFSYSRWWAHTCKVVGCRQQSSVKLRQVTGNCFSFTQTPRQSRATGTAVSWHRARRQIDSSWS